MTQAIRLVGQVLHLLSYIDDPDLCILIVVWGLLLFPRRGLGSSWAKYMFSALLNVESNFDMRSSYTCGSFFLFWMLWL